MKVNLLEKYVNLHKTLNNVLWNNYELKPEVRNTLLKITDKFIKFCNYDLKVLDIIFTGSNANYNYTENSDIDLHILAENEANKLNFDLEDYITAKKTLWNMTRDITIYGHRVEIYVQYESDFLLSSGVFSIKTNEWIVLPNKTIPKINDFNIKNKFKSIKNEINTILKDQTINIEYASKLLNKIYDMRNEGLHSVGEFSTENIVFKLLRRDGYIENLKQYIKHKNDQTLSLYK